MICYICGKPASLKCPVCGRYVCNNHTHNTHGLDHLTYNACKKYRYVCSLCFESARAENNKEQQKKYYTTHYCDFHKCFHTDKFLKSDRWGSRLGIVVCSEYKHYGQDPSFCKRKFQFCVDSAIEGETEEHICKDPENHYGDLFEDKRYLCPHCKQTVFFSRKIHCQQPAKYFQFSVKYRYCGLREWYYSNGHVLYPINS